SKFGYPLAVPPNAGQPRDAWKNVGSSLMEAMRDNQIHPAINYFAKITSAFAKNQPADFNKAVSEYRIWLQSNNLLRELKKGREEFFFNRLEPFYKAMVIYVAALLLGCAFWINLSEWIRRSAFSLLLLAFGIHTVGLLFRMYLEGRPPVTNLYSSAIFVGWGAVILGMILERIFKGGIGIVAASFIGFVTQIIAHHLSLGGDTMEMLRAVLDTNIWLSTHVVVITTGYASMFLAGFLAIIYILRGFFTRTLSDATAKSLARMVYGIICFATLFSFVGTILGGIWADQSWGRFWGWDPKENGALLIVIWCAIVLHARWGGIIRERGLMAMAVFGNIVTSFSWFGVNMLGIGLHSYGFMDAAFYWLMLFIASQAMLIIMAIMPPRLWASFKNVPLPQTYS
ncbi:MAG: cytochrome c biogenesis protein, partial [Limisphaerales bacterium]